MGHTYVVMKEKVFERKIDEVLEAIGNLADATANSFARVDKQFEQVYKRFDALEYKFDRLEYVVLKNHEPRIQTIERKLKIG